MKKILFVVLVVLTMLSLGCGGDKNKQPTQDEINKITPVVIPWYPPRSVNDHIFNTPGGVTIRSVEAVPLNVQLAIDQGIQKTIDDTRQYFPDWNKLPDLNHFMVFIIDPDGFTVQDDPGAPYINYRYKLPNPTEMPDGTVQTYGIQPTAGTVIGGPQNLGNYQGISPSSIVIAHDKASGWQHVRFVRNAVRNEAEHVEECEHNAAICRSFGFLGDVHPHRGEDIWNWPLPEPSPTLTAIK